MIFRCLILIMGMVVLFAEIEETKEDLGNRNQEFYVEFVKI